MQSHGAEDKRTRLSGFCSVILEPDFAHFLDTISDFMNGIQVKLKVEFHGTETEIGPIPVYQAVNFEHTSA
ncbi:hypothetical protein NDU88_003957 [Pleurodeles waltl]|uniref:Uncharacterized protein n=1 Tax=Pleurodeles waltl TaxID=8319 RepID=A0AAV7NLC5_PLEWA|nr:hypothetical protein NDU88_003957 [Pleurodeles waltl]